MTPDLIHEHQQLGNDPAFMAATHAVSLWAQDVELIDEKYTAVGFTDHSGLVENLTQVGLTLTRTGSKYFCSTDLQEAYLHV